MGKLVKGLMLTFPGLALACLAAVFGWYLFPIIIHGEITKQVRLIEGSETWGKWVEAPIPIYLTFYIHHVTNPDEVEQKGMKPVFEEKGPYHYLQKRKKVDISQEGSLNVVKYREVKTYFFDQERSGNNTEDDLVTVPNIPFLGVLHAIKKMLPIDFVVGLIGNHVLQGENFLRRDIRVGDLLFTGFDVSKYTNSLLGPRLPKEFSGGRFGFYKGKNGTASEVWEVFTGYENSSDFGRVKTWDGKADLLFWRKFSDCDKVKGTDGTIFSPFLTKESILDAYSPDICRSIIVAYEKDVEHLGIPGYRYSAPKYVFEDPRTRKENQCFCLEENIDDCPYSGVLPLESCTDAPIYSSPPYFLDSDVRYLAASNLPPPDPEKHQTFIDIEPMTGLILRAHKRLQISLEIKPYSKVRSLRNINKDLILFPLLWADENAELDDVLANDIKGKLLIPLEVVGVAKYALLLLGIGLFLLGLGMFIAKYVVGMDLTGIADKLQEARSDSIVSLRY